MTDSDAMKFTKWAAYYVADARLPFAACSSCRWFQAAAADGQPDCRLVERDGQPLPGEIRAKSTCGLWNAGPLRVAVAALLRGRGSSPGVAPGVLRVRLEEAFVPPPHTVPPSDVRVRAAKWRLR